MATTADADFDMAKYVYNDSTGVYLSDLEREKREEERRRKTMQTTEMIEAAKWKREAARLKLTTSAAIDGMWTTTAADHKTDLKNLMLNAFPSFVRVHAHLDRSFADWLKSPSSIPSNEQTSPSLKATIVVLSIGLDDAKKAVARKEGKEVTNVTDDKVYAYVEAYVNHLETKFDPPKTADAAAKEYDKNMKAYVEAALDRRRRYDQRLRPPSSAN